MSSEAPIFTRGFVLICLATFLSGSAQSLALPAIPLLLTQMALVAEFVGLFVGAFSLGALIVRFPVGAGVDRLGWRAFGMGGAGLLGGGCLLYALVPFVPVQVPFTATVPFLIPLAGIAHSVAFGSYGTSASSFVAHTVAATRRGEAVGYYGIVSSVAWGLGAGVSLLIVGTWGFSVPLGTAALMAALAAGALTALAFIPLLGVERGIANPGIYFTAVALTSIAFRIIAGRLADTYGRFASIVPGMLLATAGLLLVARASSTQTLVLAGIVCGTGSASAAPALLALIIDLAGPARRGAAMAIHWAMLDLGVSAGSIITGQIAPLVGYGGAFVAASCAPFVGLGGFLAYAGLRRMRARGDGIT